MCVCRRRRELILSFQGRFVIKSTDVSVFIRIIWSNFHSQRFLSFFIDGYYVVFCNKLIRLSPYTKIFIAQQYYIKNKLRVWARRSHHEDLRNMLPSKLPLLFYMKPDGGHIVSDHVYLLYSCRIFHCLVKRKIIEGNV